MMEPIFTWDKLLNEKRTREESANSGAGEGTAIGRSPYDFRDEFQRDYDRIITSSSLRRLQDKAQIFPLEKHDFVRTRLTHSIEVSSLARSLGLSIGKYMAEKEKIDENSVSKLSSLLACAGMVHDLGNPPFGHFGETAIQTWFQSNLDNYDLLKKLDKQQKKDFLNFEGNAQSLRLLTKLHFVVDQYGMNLTYGVLSAIMKYPRSSLEIGKKPGISYKKMGYFYSENTIYKDIINETHFDKKKVRRNPLTYILEAADDIAYRSTDIEDGCKKGKFNYKDLIDRIEDEWKEPNETERGLLAKIDKYKQDSDSMNYPDFELYNVRRIKVRAQGIMMSEATKAFIDHYDEIMEGRFDKELLEVSEARRVVKTFKGITDTKIFPAKDILMLELTGNTIIHGLLDEFIPAVLSENIDNPKTKEGKLYKLLSDNYRYVSERYSYIAKESDKIYNKILLVTDHICGMTDSYAAEIYQSIKGIKC